MPTAHDHYLEAEMCLEAANDCEGGSDLERYHLAAAQVHATLALAAAHGADKAAVDKLDVRTMSDPPVQGEEIPDQMGDAPRAQSTEPTECGHPECFDHQDDGTHVDSEGRYFA